MIVGEISFKDIMEEKAQICYRKFKMAASDVTDIKRHKYWFSTVELSKNYVLKI